MADSRQYVRYLLGGLLSFGAINAFGGGYYGMSGAEGVPTSWLEGSPFRSYFIPSLVLLTVVGGSLLLAAFAVFSSWRKARQASAMAAVIVLAWIGVQLAVIGYVSWLQPVTVAVAAILFLLSWLLPQPRLSP